METERLPEIIEIPTSAAFRTNGQGMPDFMGLLIQAASSRHETNPIMDYTEKSQGTGIGAIGNYYGGLWIDEQDGKCFWTIEDRDGCGWDEIPRSLYDELMKLKRD